MTLLDRHCTRYIALLYAGFWFASLLAACGTQPLLADVTTSADVLRPTGAGESLDLHYRVERDAQVSIFLDDARGSRYTLRKNEPRIGTSDPYTLRFDGTVPNDNPNAPGYDPDVRRRLLSSGVYTYTVVANAGQDSVQQRGQFRIEGSDMPLPKLENLSATPTTISPNGDAIDDVATITYRLPVTATVDISITGPDGQVYPFVTRSEEDAAAQIHTWNGKRPDGGALASGVYTYTVQAQDRFGDLVQRQGTITLADVGQPEATIISARIAPERVMLGDVITITARIKNTGNVPIRTYGPPSGYTYTTDQVFSSIEDGRYTAKSGGFWRFGVDWDANGGGGAKRYPFRWALSQRPPEQWRVPGQEDMLMPGQEIEIVGQVRILQQENKMGFYVGLIQDGVGFRQDRVENTIVQVGF